MDESLPLSEFPIFAWWFRGTAFDNLNGAGGWRYYVKRVWLINASDIALSCHPAESGYGSPVPRQQASMTSS
ncbi:hypothetical protein An16g06920 [Aspergillus niger]|uniref:Uncharacterized protein n=2 Tax=Aspergillus niger TaxID=5061 RepID=A2R8F2_ASPNC|nr:hypothetical protein An16g06920 [Aspergillus niger]CAK47014.1 hypothetical protein An16g06920 [Aspergillus niger]